MSVGHGALGLRDRIRPFRDLMLDNGGSRRCYLDLKPAKVITGWVLDSGTVYKTTISAASLTYAGVTRAIVGLESLILPRLLTRVERLADVKPGAWFWDDSSLTPGGTADLYLELPDSSDPSGTTVVAHLLFTMSTRAGEVDAGGGLRVVEVHPVVGDEKAPNARMNTWGSATDLTDWSEDNVGASGVSVTRESTDPLEGAYAARIAPGGSGLAATSGGGIGSAGAIVAQDRDYYVSVAYRTSQDMPAGLEARLVVGLFNGFVTYYMDADGFSSSTGGAEGFLVAPTFGEWRRALFVFRAPIEVDSCFAQLRLYNATGGAITGGFVDFDDFHFRRIYRYALYEALLSDASIAEVEIESQSILFGAKSVGIGSLSFLDRDGDISKALASLLLFRKPAAVFVGGTFATGEDLARDDWRAWYPAIIERPTFTDGRIALSLEDARSKARAQVFASSYRGADAGTLDGAAEGLPKPLLFGQTLEHIIAAAAVDVDANGYAYYEFVDPTVPQADATPVILPDGYSFKAYPNKELADADLKGYEVVTPITSSSVANPTTITTPRPHGLTTGDSIVISGHAGSTPSINGTRTVTVTGPTTFTIPVNVTVAGAGGKLVSSADFEITNQNTRWHVKRDIRNYRYDRAGDDVGTDAAFYFDTELSGAPGDKVARVNVEGPAWRVAAELQAAMRAAVGGGDTATTVTYSESTHQFTVARSGGGAVLNLRIRNTYNPESHKQSWKLVGFKTDQDKTGATTYTSDNATFGDHKADHVLRFAGGGFKDDASGSIIGLAGHSLNTPPAAASWILQKVLSEPPASIDLVSFKAAHETARDVDFAELFLYLHDVDDAGDAFKVLALLQQVGLMDLVLDGEGVWQCRKFVSSTAGAREFFDRDYLTWKMWQEPGALFKGARVHGAYHPGRKRFMTYAEAAVGDLGSMPVRAGAEDVFNLDGYLSRNTIESGLNNTATYYGRLIGKMPRVVEFSAVGKLVDLVPGDKVRLTRSRAFDPSGALAGVVFRIVGLRHAYLSGISTCKAVEDVQILT